MSVFRRLIVATTAASPALMLTALLGASNASAQISWKPPCGAVKVINNTNCQANIEILTTPSNVVGELSIPPFSADVVITRTPATYTIDGIVSQAGNVYTFTAPGAGVVCGAGEWSIASVMLNSSPSCCFDICANVSNCEINLWPAATPVPCNP